MDIKLEDFEIKVEEIDSLHPEQETFQQDSLVFPNTEEASIKEELKEDFSLNQIPFVPKSINSEFVKVEKETESVEEKWFNKISASKYPKVLLKRLSTDDLKIYLKGVKNYDFKKDLLQIRDQERETLGASFKTRKASCKNADANLGSEGKVIPKRSTTSSGYKSKYKCAFCKSVFKKQRSLESHMRMHSNAKLFKCHVCNYETNYNNNLKKHILIHGPNQDKKVVLNHNENLKCSVCNYKGKSRKSLEDHHLLSHPGEKQFKCSQCSYGSNDRKNFKRHLLQHTGIKRLRCVECVYACNEKWKLRRHMLTHSQTKLFMCYDCGYGCNYKDSFDTHLLNHHQLEPPDHGSTNLEKCAASECVCSEKYRSKIHMLIQKRWLKCSECGFECARKGNLKLHMLKHLEKKLFKCSECDYESNYKRVMKVHVLDHHSDVKLYNCSECNYGSNDKERLKNHVIKHSKEKLFKCSECNYGSNDKLSLKIHVLRHSKVV